MNDIGTASRDTDAPPAAGSPVPLRPADLDYELPARLVATRPAEPRDAARLLVVRVSDPALEHRRVRDLPEHLAAGDVVVLNDTAVAPARLVGRRAGTGGRIEGLFLEERADRTWRLMLKPARRLRPGDRIELAAARGTAGAHVLRLVEREAGGGTWLGRIEPETRTSAVLDEVGRTPLPPYIQRARAARSVVVDDAADRRWYQTTFADPARRRSVAAPTAGLHFTPALLEAIDARGARRTRVTLHVGPGTFRPISAATLDEHEMHEEWYEVPAATLDAVRAARGGRVVAVGTTSVRALESLPAPLPASIPGRSIVGTTDLLIAPPYRFRHVDALLTNFHLPRSTLLALVAARLGLARTLAVYEEAIRREYRFYSYGDAMLILP